MQASKLLNKFYRTICINPENFKESLLPATHKHRCKQVMENKSQIDSEVINMVQEFKKSEKRCFANRNFHNRRISDKSGVACYFENRGSSLSRSFYVKPVFDCMLYHC